MSHVGSGAEHGLTHPLTQTLLSLFLFSDRMESRGKGCPLVFVLKPLATVFYHPTWPLSSCPEIKAGVSVTAVSRQPCASYQDDDCFFIAPGWEKRSPEGWNSSLSNGLWSLNGT